jgi:hypothetical protein
VELEIRTWNPALQRILEVAAEWSVYTQREVVVTSLNDHIHTPQSLHYQDRAVDFTVRTQGGAPDRLALTHFATWLTTQLGAVYEVIWDVPGHYNHVHVETGKGS